MPERLGPRFAVEAVFLVVLATLAALADLSWSMIVLCMGIAWLLAATYEYLRWAEEAGADDRCTRILERAVAGGRADARDPDRARGRELTR